MTQGNFNFTPGQPIDDALTALRNFRVYSVHQEIRELTIQVPFNPTHVFIVNQTEATLYLQRGGNLLTGANAADLIILPNTFYNFKPQFGGYLYDALLVYPPGYVNAYPYWQCQICFYEGSMNMTPYPKPDVVTPLNPLPPPSDVSALGFDVAIEPLGWCESIDFTGGEHEFQPATANTVYTPGVGWTNVDPNIRSVSIFLPNAAGYTIELLRVDTDWIFVGGSGANLSLGGLTYIGATPYDSFGCVACISPAAGTGGFDLDGTAITQLAFPQLSQGGAASTADIVIPTVYIQGAGTAPGIGDPCIPSIVIPGARVTFTPITTGVIGSYLWFFGDGDISNDPTPTHDYAADGVYSVTLCVYGLYGGFSCVSADLYINAVPDAVQEYV